MLPKIAIHGLQIVSPSGGRAIAAIDPVAGIDDPGPGPTLGGITLGKGGGPAAETGIAMGDGTVGSGGGFADGAGSEGSCASGEAGFSTGSEISFSLTVTAAADSKFVFGIDSRNSGIGCQADFDSLQARSAALNLPSASFSRIADSEKRPASCPFR